MFHRASCYVFMVTNLNLGQDTTREPDPKHLEHKHKNTRKTATHDRTPSPVPR
jgi:hypothetical protein